ncbi:MAG: hypothetical protein M1118_05880 [Chloroflexi bacterium]|nr:hypothetical protein [Chloroflexota bacterium]
MISARSSDNTLGSPGYPEYKAAIDAWVRNGFTVAAVLPPEFDRPGTAGSTFCPNAGPGKNNNPLLNDYIDDWSFRAADFAGQLASHSLTTYWVWNEPNTDGSIAIGANCPAGSQIPGTNPPQFYHPTSLSPQNFAAMLYQDCTRIKSTVPQAITYAGGLSVLPGTDPNGPYVAGYLEAMYQYLNQSLVRGPYPWDALSLNMEGYPDSGFIASVITAIQGKQQQYGDTNDGTSTGTSKPLLIGEWGVRNSELDPTRARPTYNALRMAFPKAMYFFQHPNFFSDHRSTDYGARDWNVQGGQYVPADKLLWWDVLYSYYQTP